MRAKLQRRIMVALGLSGLIPLAFASTLSDPTRPDRAGGGQKAVSAASRWVLNSTLIAPQRRVAVINGRLVSEGETVDGARVVEIGKLKVLIQVPGRLITLQLLPETLRKHKE